jgi:hypothetical protein
MAMAAGAGFYGGPNPNAHVDWYDQTNTYGFVAVTVSSDRVTIDFIDSRGQSFHQVTVESEGECASSATATAKQHVDK